MPKKPFSEINMFALTLFTLAIINLFIVLNIPKTNYFFFTLDLVFFILIAPISFLILFLYKKFNKSYIEFRKAIKNYIEYYYGINLTNEQIWKLATQHEYRHDGVMHWYTSKTPFTSKKIDINTTFRKEGQTPLFIKSCYLYLDPKTSITYLCSLQNNQPVPFQKGIQK